MIKLVCALVAGIALITLPACKKPVCCKKEECTVNRTVVEVTREPETKVIKF